MSYLHRSVFPSFPNGRALTLVSKEARAVFVTKERDGLHYVWILEKGRRLRWDEAFRSKGRALRHMQHVLVVGSKALA
jgi:hypothetical protein